MSGHRHPRKGVIGMLPGMVQPFGLRTAYALRLPLGLLPRLDDEYWPDDLWQGDEELGKHIANRRFTLAGCDISFSRHIGWFSKEGSVQWLRALHSFGWMRDVVAYNPHKSGAKLLRNFVEDWLFASDRLHPIAREPDVMGERLASWVLYGRLLQGAAPVPFRRRQLHSMVRQALDLRGMVRTGEGDPGLPALKGLLYVALTLPQCGFLYKDALQQLQKRLPDYTRVTHNPRLRNPQYLHTVLRDLIAIRSVLYKLAGKTISFLDEAIFELGLMLHALLHGDGGFALFNGAVEGRAETVMQTLRHIGDMEMSPQQQHNAERQTPSARMEHSGYARLDAAQSMVLVDVAVPDYAHSDGYFGTLSFEMSHAAQRYVVNCGAFIGNDPAWSRVVKTTAAHSTICIDDRNSCQFHTAGIQASAEPKVERRLAHRDGYHFFEGSYNGYAPYCGLVHTRQLLMNDEGTRFSGADQLQVLPDYQNPRSHDVNLRFHLHPSVRAKRLMNGMVVLTAADGGEEWTFHASVGQAVDLEEGIYLGIGGKPVSTTQIVIYAPFTPGDKWAIEWSFIKS